MNDVQPGILALIAVTLGLGLIAFVVVTTTAFMKISVVLLLVRNALGAQQVPPNIVLYGAALILTVYISAPIGEQVYQQLSDPAHQYRTFDDWMAGLRRAQEPIRDHLKRFTPADERQFFLSATRTVWPEEMRQKASTDDLAILVPSFLIAELKRAFG